MKKILCVLLLVCLCCASAFAIIACNRINMTDYVSRTKLDLNAPNATMEVKGINMFIDGDTTHFIVPDGFTQFPSGILKARYMGVNTPESTGVIEPWGKQASNFTKSKLEKATSIILQSDDGNWTADSTGSRYLVWVWYQPAENAAYRLLNLELLQEGLATTSKLEGITYENECKAAWNQAQDLKLKMFSDELDPLFDYGASRDVTIKYIRTHADELDGRKVAFTAIVARDYDHALYVESYDVEDDMVYGMYIYYGFSIKFGTHLFVPGNEIHFVGKVGNSEQFGLQVTDIKYDSMLEDENEYYYVMSEGNEVSYRETTVEQFNGKKIIEVENDGETKEFKYAELALKSSISLKDLKVVRAYTTNNPTATSIGAMTLYCEDANGNEITVRTEVLHEDDDGNKPLVTQSAYLGKTIDVKGFVDVYEGEYQIRVHYAADITVK